MTYDDWYGEWKKLWDEQIEAERVVADYAAKNRLTTMEEWAEFHRRNEIFNGIRRRRDDLTEQYKAAQRAP